MADHDELVAEMPVLETMGTQERQKLAKKRRLQQLKRWSQREKEWIAKEKQLNKRLANIMSDENNGLNLKQYTTYNSNQRATKRLVNSNNTPNQGNQNLESLSDPKLITNGTNKKEFNNNNTLNGPYSNNLQPNGRVHFNVGVMLLEAAARNDYEEVKRLLSLGVSPDSVNHDGLTALHQCCIDASEPILKLLLDFGADVDARDTEHWTPLHAACTCGHLNLVKILVEHNADLLAVNGDANMPFDICEDEATLDYIESQMVKQGITQEMIDLTRASTEMNMLNDLEKLASTQADLNEADENGITRLHIAATNNYLSAVKFLINHGVNVNVCDNDLWQPIHGVACWGNEQHIKVVELLVEAGANLDSRTLNDETVFDLCDNVELLERLNQLKDELESKQAKGTGKLRRTQSRTNSRVHSVRRTSVRDKNQISRREAREEAMLRVDSNSEKPINLVANGSTAPIENGNNEQTKFVNMTGPTGAEDNRVSDDAESRELMAPVEPRITNLDEPDNLERNSDDSTSANDDQKSNRSQCCEGNSSSVSSKVGQALQDTIDRPRMTGIRILEAEPDGSDKMNDPKQQQQSITPPTTRVNTPHQNSALSTQQVVCDPNHQRQSSTISTVQVQFAPINYTLSNLKKHRSDLRMRTSSIAVSGISTASLNASDGIHKSNVDANGANPDILELMANARDDVRLDSGSESRAGNDTSTCVDSSMIRSESSSSHETFRKFHGEPSDVLGCESSRRVHHKCCVVI